MTDPQFPIRAEDWPAVSRLFDEAVDLGADARAAFLARLDAEQPGLSTQVRALLASSAERETGDWLERGPRLPGQVRIGTEPQAGDTVGRYRLMARCGAGGMGEVWQADALEGPARRVALKLPLWHRPGTAAAERFAREGRILATLDHPHIARLFDAGTADNGTPYLAMEWVEGEPLTAWCDARQLGVPERLQLFQQVLEAVAYAHARLVLHRDLKPAHLLVTPQGQVKLLDFGIAKLLDDDTPADATELTRAAGRVMTAAYAAPEQVRGEPLTTAADLYALGVVLFELLTGRRPYAPRLNTPAQLETAIVEGQLMRPTDAPSDADAQARGVSRAVLVKQLRGDLGAVLDKALQLAPGRRYASAEALSADLRRHLQGRPVLAAHTSGWQRAWKFTQRHRVGVAASTLAVCSLVGVTATALWQAHEAQAQRDEAQAQRARAEASLATTEHFAFFLGDLLGDALAAGSNEPPSAVVARAERMARGEFADDPETLSRVLQAVGQHHGGIGESERAAKFYEEARTLTHDRAQLQAIDCGLGMMVQRMGKREEALKLLAKVADDPTAEPVSRANCASYQATVLLNMGDIDGALKAADNATAYWRAMPRPTLQFEAPLLVLKASILMYTPRVAEADALFQRAVVSMKKLARDQGMSYVVTLNNWALTNFLAGQLHAAQARHDETLALAKTNAGAQGVSPINVLNAATDRLEGGDYKAALDFYDQTLTAAQAWKNPGFAASAQCLGAVALLRDGREAEGQKRLAAGRAEKLTDSPGDRIAAGNCNSANAQFALAHGDGATALKAYEDLLATPKLRDSTRAHYLQWRSRAQLASGNAAAAVSDAEASLKIARQLQGAQPESFRTALALDALARAQAGTPEAAVTRQQADAALAASVAPTHWLRQPH